MKSARARRVPRHAPRLALALAFSSALAQSAAPTLPAVTVTANSAQDQDLPAPYAGGQVAQGARLGMMGNQDVMDTPFNVTSYTAELIQNQQARTLADVMANDASVRFTTSSGHAYENFRIRGFDVNQNDVAINGMYGLAPMGRTPLEFVERVEVLKGPNALFSGMAPSGAVGGTINLVPKRADDTPNATFGVNWQETASWAPPSMPAGASATPTNGGPASTALSATAPPRWTASRASANSCRWAWTIAAAR
ncbi:TonB-dependent receptor plug domain-containing protein [Achromobacter xylosoxidans]